MADCKNIPKQITDSEGTVFSYLWNAVIQDVIIKENKITWIKFKLADNFKSHKDYDLFYSSKIKKLFHENVINQAEEKFLREKGQKLYRGDKDDKQVLTGPTFQFHQEQKDITQYQPVIKSIDVKPGKDGIDRVHNFVFAYYNTSVLNKICYPNDRLKCLKKNSKIRINFKENGHVHSICLLDVEPCEKLPPPPKKELPKVDLAPDDDTVGSFQIGIAKLPVNPIYISVERRTGIENVPVLRQPTSLQKGTGHQEIVVSFSCYFYERNQIRKSLVPLIAHFRYTPFVPVINEYLNEDQDIDALALQNLTLSTVEGFPKLIKVDITALKFDWRNYILWPPGADLDDVAPTIISFWECIDEFLYRQYMKTLTDPILDEIDRSGLEGSEVIFKYVPEDLLRKREKHLEGKDTLGEIS